MTLMHDLHCNYCNDDLPSYKTQDASNRIIYSTSNGRDLICDECYWAFEWTRSHTPFGSWPHSLLAWLPAASGRGGLAIIGYPSARISIDYVPRNIPTQTVYAFLRCSHYLVNAQKYLGEPEEQSITVPLWVYPPRDGVREIHSLDTPEFALWRTLTQVPVSSVRHDSRFAFWAGYDRSRGAWTSSHESVIDHFEKVGVHQQQQEGS